MRADQALARLDQLQRPIRAALREARPLLDDQDASRFKALSLLRWRMQRMMGEYERFKHEVVFDPLIAEGGERAGTARLLKARCMALTAEVEAHVRRWSLQAPLQDWPGYRETSRRLRRRIATQLDEERAAVRDLLAGPAPA